MVEGRMHHDARGLGPPPPPPTHLTWSRGGVDKRGVLTGTATLASGRMYGPWAGIRRAEPPGIGTKKGR